MKKILILAFLAFMATAATLDAQMMEPYPAPPPPPPAPAPVVQHIRMKGGNALEPARRVYDTCKSCYQGYRYRADDTPIDTAFFMGEGFAIFT